MGAFMKLRTDVESINKQAEDAIRELSFYDDTASNYEQKNKDLKDDNIIYEEDEAIIEREGKPIISHEDDKMSIYSRLESMAQSMKSFTMDIESKLDKAYKSGAQNKFGYGEVLKETTDN